MFVMFYLGVNFKTFEVEQRNMIFKSKADLIKNYFENSTVFRIENHCLGRHVPVEEIKEISKSL